jgi:RNA polymerase sigma factor (sigma-70 family)
MMESQASNRTEAETIVGILAGETELYHELIRPHEQSVYLMALSYMKTISPALLRDWREIPSEAVEREDVRKLIQQAVEELPDIYRQVFLLRDVEELNINEIAKVLNLSIPIVKVRLHHARVMLQKRLAPQLTRTRPGSISRWLP